MLRGRQRIVALTFGVVAVTLKHGHVVLRDRLLLLLLLLLRKHALRRVLQHVAKRILDRVPARCCIGDSFVAAVRARSGAILAIFGARAEEGRLGLAVRSDRRTLGQRVRLHCLLSEEKFERGLGELLLMRDNAWR